MGKVGGGEKRWNKRMFLHSTADDDIPLSLPEESPLQMDSVADWWALQPSGPPASDTVPLYSLPPRLLLGSAPSCAIQSVGKLLEFFNKVVFSCALKFLKRHFSTFEVLNID